MALVPAGVPEEATGHLHVLIDTALPTDDAPLVVDAQHVDWAGGESTGPIYLARGEHTLQLVLTDSNHVVFRPVVASAIVRVMVTEGVRSEEEAEAKATPQEYSEPAPFPTE